MSYDYKSAGEELAKELGIVESFAIEQLVHAMAIAYYNGKLDATKEQLEGLKEESCQK